MNSFLACATVAQSPTHAIVTAESMAVLAGLLFAFFAYGRHQVAARDPSKRPIPTRALMVGLGGWLAVCLVIPFAVHALHGSGWPAWSICAPAPILQCIGWFAAFLVGVGWLASRDVFAHLRERRTAGQPAFARTVPMSRPYVASRLAPESQPAPYALRELLRMQPSVRAIAERHKWIKTMPIGTGPQPSATDRQQARADAAAWGRPGTAARLLNSR